MEKHPRGYCHISGDIQVINCAAVECIGFQAVNMGKGL